MSKLYLPMMVFTVKADNGREQTVIIPRTGDISYDDYLKVAYTEITKQELMKSQASYQVRKKIPLSEIEGALREYNEWRKKKQA